MLQILSFGKKKVFCGGKCPLRLDAQVTIVDDRHQLPQSGMGEREPRENVIENVRRLSTQPIYITVAS